MRYIDKIAFIVVLFAALVNSQDSNSTSGNEQTPANISYAQDIAAKGAVLGQNFLTQNVQTVLTILDTLYIQSVQVFTQQLETIVSNGSLNFDPYYTMSPLGHTFNLVPVATSGAGNTGSSASQKNRLLKRAILPPVIGMMDDAALLSRVGTVNAASEARLAGTLQRSNSLSALRATQSENIGGLSRPSLYNIRENTGAPALQRGASSPFENPTSVPPALARAESIASSAGSSQGAGAVGRASRNEASSSSSSSIKDSEATGAQRQANPKPNGDNPSADTRTPAQRRADAKAKQRLDEEIAYEKMAAAHRAEQEQLAKEIMTPWQKFKSHVPRLEVGSALMIAMIAASVIPIVQNQAIMKKNEKAAEAASIKNSKSAAARQACYDYRNSLVTAIKALAQNLDLQTSSSNLAADVTTYLSVAYPDIPHMCTSISQASMQQQWNTQIYNQIMNQQYYSDFTSEVINLYASSISSILSGYVANINFDGGIPGLSGQISPIQAQLTSMATSTMKTFLQTVPVVMLSSILQTFCGTAPAGQTATQQLNAQSAGSLGTASTAADPSTSSLTGVASSLSNTGSVLSSVPSANVNAATALTGSTSSTGANAVNALTGSTSSANVNAATALTGSTSSTGANAATALTGASSLYNAPNA